MDDGDVVFILLVLFLVVAGLLALQLMEDRHRSNSHSLIRLREFYGSDYDPKRCLTEDPAVHECRACLPVFQRILPGDSVYATSHRDGVTDFVTKHSGQTLWK